jgi:hypothetical protein
MEISVFHAGHTDAGFFVHAINSYYKGLALDLGRETVIKSRAIDLLSYGDIESLGFFVLMVPLLNPGRITHDTKLSESLLSPAIVNAINEERCRLIFDFSNESGTSMLLDEVTRQLSGKGVLDPAKCWIICQNRLFERTSPGRISVAHFDFFILAAVNEARKILSPDVHSLLVEKKRLGFFKKKFVCLNATPRLHRIHTLLEMIDQGLIDLNFETKYINGQSAFLSMPLLEVSKVDPLTRTAINQYLDGCGSSCLAKYLDGFIESLPLEADSLAEKGNQLATKITMEHYSDSGISIVTETGVDSGNMRLTEKLIKPLALGHPFVVVGHIGSARLVKTLGYSDFSEFIDHRYDAIASPSFRIKEAVKSAGHFLERLKAGSIDLEALAMESSRNIQWTKSGFLEYYWRHCVESVIELFRPHPPTNH